MSRSGIRVFGSAVWIGHCLLAHAEGTAESASNALSPLSNSLVYFGLLAVAAAVAALAVRMVRRWQ